MNIKEAKAAAMAGVEALNRQYGKNTINRLGDSAKLDVEVISSGRVSIDHALGVGGFPRGRVIEVYGPESGGKTTLTLHVIAEAQRTAGITLKNGYVTTGQVAFIDAEHALDPKYARQLGVIMEDLFVSQPDNGEQALTVVESLVKTGAFDVIVIDSVAALVPQAELEGDMGDPQMGLQARLMSQALRKLVAFVGKTQCCVIFINQVREKIGIAYGNPEVTTGGRALKFYSSVRVEVRRSTVIKDGEVKVGSETKVKIVKNKVAPPFTECVVDIMFGKGFSRQADLLNLGVELKVVEKNGSWFNYKADRLGQGKDAVVAFLEEHNDVADKIEKEVRALLALK